MPGGELQRIRDIYLRFTRDYPPYPGGEAEKWYQVVVQFLNETGADVITSSIVTAEERALELGLSSKYIAALTESLRSDFRAVSDNDFAVLLLTSSSEERIEALKKIGVWK
jgi:hypothetical protein